MLFALVFLWFLNLIDTVGTWYAVGVMEYAREANPVMRALISEGWWLFFSVKITFVTGAAWLFWYRWKAEAASPRQRDVIRYVIAGVIAIYVAIDTMHAFYYLMFLGGN